MLARDRRRNAAGNRAMTEEPVPTAGDIMTREFPAVLPSLLLFDAVLVLGRARVPTAFVVDENQQLVGILTDKDCLRALAARCYDEAGPQTVQDVMVTPSPQVTSRTDLYALTQDFLGTPAGILPVIDDGTLIGGVTEEAVFRALLGALHRRTRLLADSEQVQQDIEDRPTSIERMQKVFADWSPAQIASVLRRTK